MIKYCPKCGTPVKKGEQICSSCHEVLVQTAPNQPAQQQYPQQQYVPQSQYMPPPPTMYTQQYIPPVPPKQYSANIPLIILSIFNIAVGWCCGVGTILGIVALIQAIDRKDAKNDEEARKCTLLSLLFNIIALVVLSFSLIVPIIAFGGYVQMLEMLTQ